MSPQKKQVKHLKKISSAGTTSRKLKELYNVDLSKIQIIEILKSMSSDELQEIIYDISSSRNYL